MQQVWVHFAFSWAGAAYDLFIVFFLLWRPTRPLAFVAVVVFHVLTRVLFPIGMFPYIMIVSALVFFDAGFHNRLLNLLRSTWSWVKPTSSINLSDHHIDQSNKRARTQDAKKVNWSKAVVYAVLALHLVVPWRYLVYPGELFWTEEGYRFSWRVMLMEKAGYLNYKIVDPTSGKRTVVNPADYLTTFQNKQLATQPDFILEFAHHLASLHQEKDGPLPAVYAESYVALNGRGSKVYVNPDINLSTITNDTPRTEWLMPFEDTIYGL